MILRAGKLKSATASQGVPVVAADQGKQDLQSPVYIGDGGEALIYLLVLSRWFASLEGIPEGNRRPGYIRNRINTCYLNCSSLRKFVADPTSRTKELRLATNNWDVP